MALKIAIEAGLIPHGQSGGVEQFVMGLVHGLGRLADGDDEYIVTGRLEGNFPGGTAALRWRFALAGDLIRRLHIAP